MAKDTTSVQEAEVLPNNTPEQVVDTSMDHLIQLTFTKKEWIIIFNVLVRSQYGLADAMLVKPIVDKIQPIVAQSSQNDVKPVMKSDIPNN